MAAEDSREWRIYRSKFRFRARELPGGLGWEVEDSGGGRLNYTDEDFRARFEIAAQTAKIVDSATQTVHYS